MTNRLWEIKHPYYCADSQWYFEFDSWDDFLSNMLGADKDYNFLIAWHWRDSNDPDWELKTDLLHLTYIRQRMGTLYTYKITVDKQDERRITQFLLEHWLHVVETWAGISDIPEGKPEDFIDS